MRCGAILLLVACAGDPVTPLADRYWEEPEWESFATWGETPGHGDTYRIIYFNAEAAAFSGGWFPRDAILVKEIYDNAGAQPGKLRVIEFMTRSIQLEDATGTLVLDPWENRMGWVFSAASTRGGEQVDHSDFCWRRCHASAPFGGAWFDYGTIEASP
jgi:hypothetical protein